jgi:hypothetical protein
MPRKSPSKQLGGATENVVIYYWKIKILEAENWYFALFFAIPRMDCFGPWPRRGEANRRAQPSRVLVAAVFSGWSVSVYDGSMIDVNP